MKEELPEKLLTDKFYEKHLSNFRYVKPKNYEKWKERIKEASKRRIVLMLGAGMGAGTHLPMGNATRIRLENELVLPLKLKQIQQNLGLNCTEELSDENLKNMKASDYKLFLESLLKLHNEIEIKYSAYISEISYRENIQGYQNMTGSVGKMPDFEMYLASLSKTPAMEKAVRDFLVSLFKVRHHTSLGHKAVAHLFKHGIIDTIINFNFDEQLDKAIADITRRQEYSTVISDGDVDDVAEKLHIKPHGTVSHPSTMRFRKDDYTLTPQGILEKIDKEFVGKVTLVLDGFSMESVEINHLINRKVEKVLRRAGHKILEISEIDLDWRIKAMKAEVDKNLILLSEFESMHNAEETRNFKEKQRNELIQKFPELKNIEFEDDDLDLEIFTIKRSPLKQTGMPAFDILNAVNPRNHHLYSDESTNEKLMPGEDVLPNIIDEMRGLTEDKRLKFRPLDLGRAVSVLFKNLVYDAKAEMGEKNPENLDDDKYLVAVHYLQILIEILFATSKGKGFLDLQAGMDEKIGMHYQHYLKSCKCLNIEPVNLHAICKSLGLINHTYSAKSMIIPIPKHWEEISPKARKKEMKDWIFENLEQAVIYLQRQFSRNIEINIITEKFLERLKSSKEDEKQSSKANLFKALEILFNGQNREIYHPEESTVMPFFPEDILEEVEKIHSWEDLAEITLENIRQNNWDEVWISTRSGEWFFQGKIWQEIKNKILRKKKKITVRMIATEFTVLENSAQRAFEKSLSRLPKKERDLVEKNLEFIYEKLPYWEHNHLLTACVKREEEKFKIQTAIHGSRENKKDFMSPIVLRRKEKDISEETENYLKYLENMFKAYFVSTQKIKREKSDIKNRYFVDKIDGLSVGEKIEAEWEKVVD